MAKVLDTYSAATIADALEEFLDDLGFPPEEAIPGLVMGILRLSLKTKSPDEALDEAANLLADAEVE